jgi:hypothetical protein
LDDPQFVVIAHGRCDLQRPPQHGVVPIYALGAQVEAVRRTFREKRVDRMDEAA